MIVEINDAGVNNPNTITAVKNKRNKNLYKGAFFVS